MRHQITWREFFKVLTTTLCVLTVGGRLAAGAAQKPPNVLILTTDQQRVDAMSAMGNQWLKTPNMDSLARQGVCFRNSYCVYPLCSPCRASLHAGRPPHEIGVDHNSLPIAPAIPLLGQVFRAAGYDTAYAGKLGRCSRACARLARRTIP